MDELAPQGRLNLPRLFLLRAVEKLYNSGFLMIFAEF